MVISRFPSVPVVLARNHSAFAKAALAFEAVQ